MCVGGVCRRWRGCVRLCVRVRCARAPVRACEVFAIYNDNTI